MNYKVIINPELGGNELGNKYNNTYDKDYNLKFSKLLSNKLKENGIDNLLTRTEDKTYSVDDRIKFINSINNKPLVITIGLGNSLIDIIYGLGNKDTLASILSSNFEKNNFQVNKYYQQRDSINTNEDYEKIIGKLKDHESIIIRLGNIEKDNTYLNSNINGLVDSIVDSLKQYIGINEIIYTVKKGDNLYSISRKYNTTVDKIKRMNGLTSDIININQKLKIPDSDNITYKVVKGDTLYSIAKKYNTTVKDIMNINGLNSTNLKINQILKI